jgi:hypothetical protein
MSGTPGRVLSDILLLRFSEWNVFRRIDLLLLFVDYLGVYLENQKNCESSEFQQVVDLPC